MKRKLSHTNQESEKKVGEQSTWSLYSLVSTVAVICHLNGLNGDFVHDDIPAVIRNKDVLANNPLGRIFMNDFWGTPMAEMTSHKSYRPFTVLTFRANYLVFGLNPAWFHLTNILLHSAACSLFTRVCLCVAGLRPQFAALAGILFAIHPIHTEAVTGIVGRADVLACMFFLLSLLAYHGRADGIYHVWISILLGGLSMLSKETGITILVINLAYDFFLHWHCLKRSLGERKWNKETLQFTKRAAKILTSLGILLTLRLAILQGSLPKFSQQDNPAAFHPSIYVRFLTFGYLAAFNMWLLLCPSTLSHDWQMGSIPLVTTISDLRNLVTIFFLGLTFLLAIKSLSEFEPQKHTPLVLGLLLLVLPFLPASNLLVTVGFVVAERLLYIPSLGSILLIVYGIQILWYRCYFHRQTIVSLVLLLLVSGVLRTLIRNRDWLSRESLLRAGLITLPYNAKMHYNYANFLRDAAKPELAKTHYLKALELWPAYASAHNNIGTLLDNRYEAELHFLLAIRHYSEHINAHYNLGKLYRMNNRSIESERMLRKCIKLDPRFTPAYIELAKLRGPNDQSVNRFLKEVVIMNPSDPYFSTNFANWLSRKGNYKDALWHYWKSLQISPTHEEALAGAAKILQKFGQKARLFQLITRWQVVKRSDRGQLPLGRHLYLQVWRLNGELSHRAKIYDVDSTSLTTSTAQTNSNPSKIGRNSSRPRTDNTNSLRPLTILHFLDSV
ncbi:protein O-mannosyl-transferase TMTC1-like [Diorhabda sublineata]|uniref:protein O-mannosyl-transferase TMTC1-like n=1 Tax=Diorhabda sublineata TaxID=1163346 RepID=UPI0024E0EB2B|nr:protein O-mannosyl-transferase TMTC1-like [Diorhabda sublineata]XP_056640086.1 protein O-mannosyl-transferase TMTC1-like [Diorhabda sublineata]